MTDEALTLHISLECRSLLWKMVHGEKSRDAVPNCWVPPSPAYCLGVLDVTWDGGGSNDAAFA